MTWIVLDNTNPVARKSHTCSICCRNIEAGERYHRQRVITDDGPDVWKTCAHCEVLFSAVWRLIGNDIMYYDDGLDLHEWLRDYEHGPLLKMLECKWRGVAVADIPLELLKSAS